MVGVGCQGWIGGVRGWVPGRGRFETRPPFGRLRAGSTEGGRGRRDGGGKTGGVGAVSGGVVRHGSTGTSSRLTTNGPTGARPGAPSPVSAGTPNLPLPLERVKSETVEGWLPHPGGVVRHAPPKDSGAAHHEREATRQGGSTRASERLRPGSPRTVSLGAVTGGGVWAETGGR